MMTANENRANPAVVTMTRYEFLVMAVLGLVVVLMLLLMLSCVGRLSAVIATEREMVQSYSNGIQSSGVVVVKVVDRVKGGVVAVCCELYGHVVDVELFVG